MNLSQQLANNFREVQLNGKWVIGTNLKEVLSDITFKEATTKIGDCNTIAALVFHLNYYIAGLNQVFEGGSLDIRDKFSFDLPAIESEEDWKTLKNKAFEDAERFAKYVETMTNEQIAAPFIKEQYGDYFRNISCQIEHSYYHFGQVVLLKKLVRKK